MKLHQIKMSPVLSILQDKKTGLENRGFTLVELIVVITILAILATIAFVSLQGYSRDARNSVRVSDTNNIETALELFSLQTGKYPKPGNSVDITGSGGVVLWNNGTVDSIVMTQLKRVSELPTDPKTAKEMKYSTTLNNKEYELKYDLEIAKKSVINITNADSVSPYVQGNYNGVYLLGSDSIFYSAPSLHTSSGTQVIDPVDFELNNKVVNFQVTELTHSGVTLSSDNLKNNYTNFGLALKTAYSTTPELNYGIYAVVSDITEVTAEEIAKSIVSGEVTKTVVNVIPSIVFTTATGGIITEDGNYRIHTFNSSGNFEVTEVGTDSTIEYLVIGGGGAGGPGWYAGGGGAGGYKTSTGHYITAKIYPITIGAGGTSGIYDNGTDSTNGENSVFDTVTAIGGGFGGLISSSMNGGSGGSGGGAGFNVSSGIPGGTSLSGQGYAGGYGSSSPGYTGGSGGGAGGIGGNSNTAGGPGLTSAITGVSIARAGGGGSASQLGIGGEGGIGGGGHGGGNYTTVGQPGIDNSGGGGGGGGGISIPAPGGVGGSGVVILRYKFQ